MAGLSQLQLTYQAVPDRLLLRVSGGDADEYRIWLTRRLVALLAAPLREQLRLLASSSGPQGKPGGAEPVEGQSHSRLRDQAQAVFSHQQAIAGLRVSKRFQRPEGHHLPLGDEPLLVSRARIRQAGADGVLLSLYPAKGQGVDLRLGSSLLHGFCELLVRATEQAEWGLSLKLLPSPAVAQPATSAVH